MASQTKLKFRQPGQTSSAEVKKLDLRAELLLAEQEARNKKRKAEGKPLIEPPAPDRLAITNGTDDESHKRRKLLEDVIDLDRDDDDDDRVEGERKQESDSEEDEEDEEDETAELLRELEKIKRERAEEKARQELEESAKTAEARAADIATANPLLNLAAALGQTPGGSSASVGGSFAVKKRWDDDLVFKNQANGSSQERPTHFVNDLLRTEFHKKFMSKFIK